VGLALPGAIRAAALDLQFDGSLGLQVSTLDPVATEGRGVASLSTIGSAQLTAMQVGPGVFSVSNLVIPITDPAAAPIQGIQITFQNGTGSFSSTASGFGGPMPIQGFARICLFLACGASPPANLTIPLSKIGVGGSTSVSELVPITVQGAAWTTATTSLGSGFTTAGFREGPLGFGGTTARTSGNMRLVTPLFISTAIGPAATAPIFAFLDLHFVPEPGAGLLCLAAIGTLVALGRRRLY
jgi:hypothetical protein